MGVMVSPSHVVSAAPSSSGGGLLTLCPCSSVKSLSRETVLHRLLQCESFPWAAALHELPQHRSFHGVQSFRNRLLQCGSSRGHKPCQKTCCSVGSSLHGSTGPGRSLLKRGLPKKSQLPSGIHLLQREVPSMGYWWISAPPCVDLHGLQGNSLPHHGLHHELQGKALFSNISGTSFPPPSLTLVSAELFLSHHLTPLSSCCLTQFFSSLS